VYGAWIDLIKRKLTTPPQAIIDKYEGMSKSEKFEIITLKNAQ
jgi:acyl-CoA thioester hydrolase